MWGREHPHPSLSSEPLANPGLQERWGGWEENKCQPASSWRPHAVRQLWGARLHRVLFPHSSSSQGHHTARLRGVTAHSPFIPHRLLICAIHLPAKNYYSLLCTIVYQRCWQNCFIFKTKTWSHSLLSMAGESITRENQLCTIMALPLLQYMMKLVQQLLALLGFFVCPPICPEDLYQLCLKNPKGRKATHILPSLHLALQPAADHLYLWQWKHWDVYPH